MAEKFLGQSGLNKLIALIKNALSTKVDKIDGKGLSTNDYTTNEKTKLSGIASGAQTNTLEGIQKNGTTVTITNKIANITVPTKTSQITNDSGFITASDVVEPSSTSPKMDGTVAVGTENKYARGDHVHPTDTSRAAASDLTSHTGNTTVHITAAERTAWNAKQNALTAGTDYLTPAQVDSAIDSKISSVYTPKGSIAFASLPTTAEGLVGDVYNITDAFTTTAAFVEGAGQSYPAGTNVVCVKEGSAYKWDVLAGFIDITELTTTEVQTIWDSVFNPGA